MVILQRFGVLRAFPEKPPMTWDSTSNPGGECLYPFNSLQARSLSHFYENYLLGVPKMRVIAHWDIYIYIYMCIGIYIYI